MLNEPLLAFLKAILVRHYAVLCLSIQCVLFRCPYTCTSSSVASDFLSWIVLIKSKIIRFYGCGRREFLALLDIVQSFREGSIRRPSVHPFVCPSVSGRRL